MPFVIYLFLITTIFAPIFSIAQHNNTIQVSICLQHANTYQLVLGASVVIKELDSNDEIMNIASMHSAIFTPTNFEVNHRYRITVEKKGFHPLDTIVVAQVSSTSNKQRLGLLLRPVICHYIKGDIVDSETFRKIEGGFITFKDLHTNKFYEIEFQNGFYEFCAISGHHYLITTRIDGHLHQSKHIELHPNPALKHDEQELSLDLQIIRNYEQAFFNGDSITAHGLTFVHNTTTLSHQGEREITKLVQVMKQMPDLLFYIAIETEEFIETHFNRKLAEQRARILEHKLNLAGISPHRYILICCGKVDASAPEGHKSQRVCLWLRK